MFKRLIQKLFHSIRSGSKSHGNHRYPRHDSSDFKRTGAPNRHSSSSRHSGYGHSNQGQSYYKNKKYSHSS